MNTKLNKIVKMAAVGIFFMALLMNVKLSLTDPFINMDNDALAQSSSSGTGQNSCYNTVTYMEASQVRYCGSCSFINNSTKSWVSTSGKC
ncbi:hypothetical protein [Algoriphagus sp. Y33]|uniref:hypothetical protein n=1 Tax=Algoriphagus sp. Y33 TaxID=2772483 RepID=UPI00177C6DD1|nr:hypothetical protein [Algoriphagus sp. Y33]